MRNPNGYGSVVALKGKRRNPFVVRKTIGKNEKGYPIYNIIGYYPTREAGMIALAQFNNDPWDVDHAKITLAELYSLWEEKKAPKLGAASRNSLKTAYGHCVKHYNSNYKTLKAFHMQECIDNCGKGYATQGAIKNLFNHLDKFALEMDITTRCYSSLLTSEPVPDTKKVPFTDDEVKTLWGNCDDEWVDSVLVFLYTGFRISELLDLRTADVDLAAGTIKGGTKTRAGKDRIVPIHSCITAMIQKRALQGNEYLFSHLGQCVKKPQYYIYWNAIMNRLQMNHTPHECRHTFRSRLDTAGANKRCIDLIMGHKSKDVGERVYTHKSIQELKNAIELIVN